MGEIARREIRITLKGDTDAMDEVEELLREALESGKDLTVKHTYAMTKETPLDEEPEDPEEEEEEDEEEEDEEEEWEEADE